MNKKIKNYIKAQFYPTACLHIMLQSLIFYLAQFYLSLLLFFEW